MNAGENAARALDRGGVRSVRYAVCGRCAACAARSGGEPSTWSSAGPRGSRCSTRRGSPSGTPTGRTTCGNGWRGAPTASPAPSAVDIAGVRHWSAGDLAGRAVLRVVPHQGDADRARVHGLRGRGRARAVEGPVAAGGERDPQGTARAGRRRTGDPAERADTAAPGDPGRRGRESCCRPRPRSTRARRTSRTWWTSSPGGCSTRRASPHGLYRRWEGELGGGPPGSPVLVDPVLIHD